MPGSKSLRMLYHAAFREAAGLGEETLHSNAATAADLYDEVAERHGFNFERSLLRVAINDSLASWTAELKDGDTVAFLSLFAGG